MRPCSTSHTTDGSLVQPIVFFHQSESRLPAKLISKYCDGCYVTDKRCGPVIQPFVGMRMLTGWNQVYIFPDSTKTYSVWLSTIKLLVCGNAFPDSNSFEIFSLLPNEKILCERTIAFKGNLEQNGQQFVHKLPQIHLFERMCHFFYFFFLVFYFCLRLAIFNSFLSL